MKTFFRIFIVEAIDWRFFSAFFLFATLCSVLIFVADAFATYTPLIAATDFTGILADVTTAAGGIVSVALVVIGLGMLVRVLSR